MLINKIKNLLILIKCFLYFLIRGTAAKKVQEPKKILIIQTAKLGDMVCTTPVFRAIKNKHLNASVTVMGNKINQELLADNHDIDNYLVKTPVFNELVKQIKAQKFDTACLITPNFENLVCCILAGIPKIIAPKVINGNSPYETKSYKILRKLVTTINYDFNGYFPKQYLKLLEPLNIYSEDVDKHLNYTKNGESEINLFFNKNNLLSNDLIIGIAPSVANKIKQWPIENFAKLADHLIENYQAKIILIGSSDDQALIDQTVNLVANKNNLIDGVGFKIDQLKALIAKLKLFISVDTGPIYIAEAFYIPTIDILGPMAANEQPPKGKRHEIVELPNRQPQLHIMNARVYDAKEARRQIEEISVEMVIAKVDKLMTDLYE